MERYKLEKPDISNITIESILSDSSKMTVIYGLMKKAASPEYLYWDRVKYIATPLDVTAEEIWVMVKFLRQHSYNRMDSLVRHESGVLFNWDRVERLEELQHEIDMNLGGMLAADRGQKAEDRRRFYISGLMEEAIASSQLEGAHTTRKAAKRMLQEKRKPTNDSERMIVNNYNTMLWIEEEGLKQELDLTTLLRLHETVVRDTAESGEVGRLRRDSDDIVVKDRTTNVIYHVPPSTAFLKNELVRFIEYANDRTNDVAFVHPIVKAIILHFWIGYLHPFTDGNGRIARAIFYWYLLKHNYWAFKYIPLSAAIKKSPKQYGMAYVYSEQDDLDLTYFVDYNLRKIAQAKKQFEEYIVRKQNENARMTIKARSKYQLNDRQIQLLKYLYKNSGATTTIQIHSDIYKVSRITARTDLEKLEKMKLLKSSRVGRERRFTVTDNVSGLFE